MKALRSNPFSLRALVKASQVISAPPPVGKSAHVLGLGISSKNTYRLPQRLARLPSTEEGVTNLRISTAVPVPGLPAQYSDGAWGALLGRPQLVVELSSPRLDDFLVTGQVVPSNLDEGSLLTLGLAVVGIPDSTELTKEYELVATPVAGVAQLLLATRKRVDTSSDAWIVANWYDSAEETAEALARLHSLSTSKLPERLAASAVLLTDSLEAWPEDRLDERIMSCAALLDHKITGYRPQDYLHKALVHVKSTPPDLLLVADSARARCAAVIDAYLKTPKASGVRYLDSTSIEGIISGIRKRLIVASGVSLNLLPVAQESSDHPQLFRGRLPIIEEGRRFYHKQSRIYIECRQSGYFYTIDDTRHGGTVAKRYVLQADGLHWNADLDENGDPIQGKFKGEAGRFIGRGELNSG